MGVGSVGGGHPFRLFCPQCNKNVGYFFSKMAAENYKPEHKKATGHKHMTVRGRT